VRSISRCRTCDKFNSTGYLLATLHVLDVRAGSCALSAAKLPKLEMPCEPILGKASERCPGDKKSIQKLFDLCDRLLYNLATPRYNKVFSQNFYSVGNGYSKG